MLSMSKNVEEPLKSSRSSRSVRSDCHRSTKYAEEKAKFNGEVRAKRAEEQTAKYKEALRESNQKLVKERQKNA